MTGVAIMKYKRETAFRYTFKEPLPAFFKIVMIDQRLVETAEGFAKIIDISPRGLKLNSELNIPNIEGKRIKLCIRFTINQEDFQFVGNIMWKKHAWRTTDYGIELLVDDSAELEIIKQLKIFSKKKFTIKRHVRH